jgi:hypothetical protein
LEHSQNLGLVEPSSLDFSGSPYFLAGWAAGLLLQRFRAPLLAAAL